MSNNDVIMQCSQLTKAYRKGEMRVTALKKVSLSLSKGEVVAATGPSGSGKSTLLNLIGLLDSPTSGQLCLFGEKCHTLSEKAKQALRRQYLGFVFQNFNLLPVLSAVENVELSLYGLAISKKKMREMALEILARVGLAHRSYHFPSELSGGQQQRVGIARALVHRPQLVMADEPTANLDSKTAMEIISIMKTLSREQGTAFLVSSHDPQLMACVDRVITLKDGVMAL